MRTGARIIQHGRSRCLQLVSAALVCAAAASCSGERTMPVHTAESVGVLGGAVVVSPDAGRVSTCDAEAVGVGLVVDTSAMRREETNWRDSEGQPATITRFFDASRLRLVRVAYLGDTRRTTFSYYLNQDGSFTVLIDHGIYDPASGPVRVASVIRQYFYFCADGTIADGDWSRWARDAQSLHSELPPGG